MGDPDTRQYSRTVEPSCTSVRSGLTCTWGSPAPAGSTGSVPAPGWGHRGRRGTTLTLHMEETPRRVLAGAAARAAHVVPLVGRLDGAEPQHPAVGDCPWWQRACGDRAPRHPCHVPHPGPRVPTCGEHLPSHSRVGAGLPVATQRNSAGCPGATLSCAGSTVAVGAVAVAAAVTRGGVQSVPAPPPALSPRGGTKQGGGVAQGARWSPGMQRAGVVCGPPTRCPPGDLPGLCPSINSTGP